MKALRVELVKEHGDSPHSQFTSAHKSFKSSIKKKGIAVDPQVYELLFSSLTYTLSLCSYEKSLTNAIWAQPSAVISWYYGCYMSVRAMFLAFEHKVDDNHSSIMKAFASSLAQHLPHPFNMESVYNKNEDYNITLPSFPSVSSSNLSINLDENDRNQAQGMICEYLNGTSNYYTWETKEKIKRREGIANFRTNDAKAIRNKLLQKKIGFMHCAFRYRGKANYRDGIYLTYGSASTTPDSFFNDLHIVSRFFFLCALAMLFRVGNQSEVKAFLEDLQHIRGIETIPESERFWVGLLEE